MSKKHISRFGDVRTKHSFEIYPKQQSKHLLTVAISDPKTVNQFYQAFSVYTNTRRLVTYNSTPKTIECLDGIRTLAMIWIICGHTFSTQLQNSLLNPLDALEVRIHQIDEYLLRANESYLVFVVESPNYLD